MNSGEHQTLIFGQMSIFCDGCASELNNTTIPSLDGIIRPIFHAVNSCLSSIHSTSSPHFCAIVAVTEADFGRRHLHKIEFCEFQECEAQNKVSRAKMHTRRRDTEVGMVAVHNVLGGRLGVDVGSER